MEQAQVEPPAKRKRRTTKSKADSAVASAGLIDMIQLFVSAKFGAEALFTPEELFLIQAPLARLIEKYGGIADQYSGVIDPLMLVAGVTLYGIRLADIAQKQAKKPTQPPLNRQWVQESMQGQQPAPNASDPINPFVPKPEGEVIPSVPEDIAMRFGGVR